MLRDFTCSEESFAAKAERAVGCSIFFLGTERENCILLWLLVLRGLVVFGGELEIIILLVVGSTGLLDSVEEDGVG